jgi:predicted nucleic acid-binding protein
MLVVADSSPLHYLVLIDRTTILPTLFGQVVIPSTVVEELQRSRTPALVRDWMSSLPAWLEIRQPRQTPEALLFRLGAGERNVIVLAQEMQATLVLMDDMEGCAAAEHLAFSVLGT